MSITILFVRLLDSGAIFSSVTHCVGAVELRAFSTQSKMEQAALRKSLEKNQESCNEMTAMIIVTSVTCGSIELGDDVSIQRFEETLDLLDGLVGFGVSRFALLDSGYTRHIGNGKVTPRIKPPNLGPVTSFRMVVERFPPATPDQQIASLPDSSFKTRFFRSLHWSRQARWEESIQLRIIFRWFAMEAVWKIDENSNVAPYIMWALGYPTGQHAEFANSDKVKALKKDPLYDCARCEISNRLDRIRKFRNDSVHQGFRPQDIDKRELKRFDLLTLLACPRVQHQAQHALVYGLQNVDDFPPMLPRVFLDVPSEEEILGTILFCLFKNK